MITGPDFTGFFVEVDVHLLLDGTRCYPFPLFYVQKMGDGFFITDIKPFGRRLNRRLINVITHDPATQIEGVVECVTELPVSAFLII